MITKSIQRKLTKWAKGVAIATQLTKAELLLAGNYVKAQILDRTARHLDADGKPFAPYSTKTPVYWNPYTGSKDGTQQRRASTRMIKKLGGSGRTGIIRDERGKLLGRRSGNIIRFEHYAAFKQALGRSGVDLIGPRAPHMLQAMTVRVAEDGRSVIVGIYDKPAARAIGHQYGNPRRRLPQRKFLGATVDDREHLLKLLSAQMRGRIRAVTAQLRSSR